MKERVPRSVKENIAQASVEGTVRMPQIGVGIVVYNTERCLTEESPKQMLAALLAPIPKDEVLEKRTARANAQHAHHAINRLLTTEDVRRIQKAGNLITINFISAGLGLHPGFGYGDPYSFDADGNWVTEPILQRAREIESHLTPEKRTLLHLFLLVAKQTLELPEIQEKLAERKKLFDNWKDKKYGLRGAAKEIANRMAEKIAEEIKKSIHQKADEIGTNEAQQIAVNIAFEFDKLFAEG